MMARQLDVDVLLWGGTHRFEAYELEGKFFVNPGSITGAMTTNPWTEADDPTPSFVLMDVSSLNCQMDHVYLDRATISSSSSAMWLVVLIYLV